jgi:DNA-binding transcriptional regulator YdaS (Cro superfamily)
MRNRLIAIGRPSRLLHCYAVSWKAGGRAMGDLADRLGISPSYLSSAIARRRPLPKEACVKLSHLSGVSLEDILLGVERDVWEVTPWVEG